MEKTQNGKNISDSNILMLACLLCLHSDQTEGPGQPSGLIWAQAGSCLVLIRHHFDWCL